MPLSVVSEISGFDSLRWDDQEKIRGKLLSGESSEAGGTSQVDGPAQDNSLSVEYAKSSRSSCKSCEDKIEKVEKFSLIFDLFHSFLTILLGWLS